MKKYFSYIKSAREVCQKPCIIDYDGKPYTSFCNSYSLVLTTEPCGAIELFTDKDRYPNMSRIVKAEGVSDKLDIHKLVAEAKSKGYKLKKSEVSGNGYLMHYDGSYFRIGLLEATYAIIDDGTEPTVYHSGKNSASPITIENSIGYCVIMPVRYDAEPGDGVTIIEVN
jgi:hypothetical protein